LLDVGRLIGRSCDVFIACGTEDGTRATDVKNL
jgi:hypothetical protein